MQLLAGPARGENFISIGSDLYGKGFEINPRLNDMLKNNTFQGDETECPYKHIEDFNTACGTFHLQDLTNEEIKAKIFPYSLERGGTEWLSH